MCMREDGKRMKGVDGGTINNFKHKTLFEIQKLSFWNDNFKRGKKYTKKNLNLVLPSNILNIF